MKYVNFIKNPLAITLVVVLLALAGVFYAIRSGVINVPGFSTKVPPTSVDQNKEIKVSFAYKVKAISPSEVVLATDRGDFILPYNIMAVTVYKGPTKESPKIPLSELKVGDNVNMEFVPGKSASLFVSAI